MKPLLIAAALLMVPAAASAQVAAGSVPNTFDRPAPAAPAAARPSPGSTTPANSKSEDVLRDFITAAQAGTIDYAVFTDDLGAKIREQSAQLTPLIQGFGAVQAVDFMRNENGSDLFAITFANAETEWLIGIQDDKIAALLFRPAQD